MNYVELRLSGNLLFPWSNLLQHSLLGFSPDRKPEHCSGVPDQLIQIMQCGPDQLIRITQCVPDQLIWIVQCVPDQLIWIISRPHHALSSVYSTSIHIPWTFPHQRLLLVLFNLIGIPLGPAPLHTACLIAIWINKWTVMVASSQNSYPSGSVLDHSGCVIRGTLSSTKTQFHPRFNTETSFPSVVD